MLVADANNQLDPPIVFNWNDAATKYKNKSKESKQQQSIHLYLRNWLKKKSKAELQ